MRAMAATGSTIASPAMRARRASFSSALSRVISQSARALKARSTNIWSRESLHAHGAGQHPVDRTGQSVPVTQDVATALGTQAKAWSRQHVTQFVDHGSAAPRTDCARLQRRPKRCSARVGKHPGVQKHIGVEDSVKKRTHLRSSACRIGNSSGTTCSACSCVAIRTTGGAAPASAASSQRAAHRHQRSPDTSPGNMNSGRGVPRSLPCSRRKFEELCRHAGADRVRADILRAGMAVPVAEEPGGGILAASCERSAEHIARRRRPISITHRSVARRQRPGCGRRLDPSGELSSTALLAVLSAVAAEPESAFATGAVALKILRPISRRVARSTSSALTSTRAVPWSRHRGRNR